MKPGIIVIVAAAAAVLLASCRDEENRAFVLDKGTYTGATYSQLSEKQIGALENRVALQGTANVTTGAARRPIDERPAPPGNKELDQRLREQAGK